MLYWRTILIKNALILAAVLGAMLAGGAVFLMSTPVELPEIPYEIEVKPGTTMKGVAVQLVEAGLIPQADLFSWTARLTGKGSALKAGNYELTAALSPWDLLQKLTRGDVMQRELKFIEGWNFRQLREALNKHPDILHDTLGMSDAEIMAQLGYPDQHPEGRFFPDTYFFSKGMSDLGILKRAHRLMQQQLEKAWAARDPNLPYTRMDDALIMASIVEKETGQAHERPQIAGVFINRLRIGMLLQTDPTVIYGLGEQFDGNLRKRDLLNDTSYNTYTRGGLPPTPIAMPGWGALHAATQPAETKALYFVAKGDGTHQFSSTLAQHNEAVNRYQRR